MKTILIVDDEFGIVETLTELLQDEGYGVVSASNGREGLACLDASCPDLAIIDTMMPIMDGPQMLKAMRALPRYAQLPVVLISSAPKSIATHGFDHGVLFFSAFLRKPFSLQELLSVLTQILGENQ